jgi:GNAT superfamily N-acetyltransferase
VTAGFVRAARASDAGDVARVQVGCWRTGYSGLVPDDVLSSLTGEQALAVWSERWHEAITNPPTSRHKVLVSVTGDSRLVTGFASVGPCGDADRWPATDAELYELRVSPDAAGQGSADKGSADQGSADQGSADQGSADRGDGGRLLHAAVDTLVEDGFHTASTWVLEADSAMREFLTSAGWAADGATAKLDVGAALPAIRLHTRISDGGGAVS